MRIANQQAPKAYFQGLNFLLNEQQDQAIDAFIEAVQNDPDTSELHFALGNLFRRRGEYERAVRVHEHLLGRADLPPGRARPRPARAGAGLPEGRPARPRRGRLRRSSTARAFETEAQLALLDAVRALARLARGDRGRAASSRRSGTGSFALAHRALLVRASPLEADAAQQPEAADAAVRQRARGRAARRPAAASLAGAARRARAATTPRRCALLGRR